MARRRQQFVRGARRSGNTTWIAGPDITGLTVLAAGAAVFDSSFALVEPHTIMRTRGSIWVVSDQTAASEQPLGALGMAVVSDQAAAIGVSAMPTPQTDADSDLFFVHQFWATGFTFISGVGVDTRVLERYDFDSKAMRKVNVDETIAVMVENGSSAFGVSYMLQFRMLIKLA